MILGLLLSVASSSKGGSTFSPLDLAPALWLTSDTGVLDATSATPDNAENVMTWQDQSGNGNHLTQPTAGFRPSYRTADGPNGGPCLRFELEQLRLTALAATITNPTIYLIAKKTHTASAYMYSGDGTPTFYLQNVSTDLCQAGVSAGTSGTFTFPNTTWGMHRLEALQGAGETQWNANQARATTALGVSTLDGFSLGSRIDYVLQANFDIAELIIVSGALSDADLKKMRLYAAAKYGFSWPSETNFLDTFDRADTADNNIGLSNSGHAWEFSGAGMANIRLLGGGLTVISPWSTGYFWFQHQFVVRSMSWDYDYIAYGGAGGGSVNAAGVTRLRQDLTDMVHFVHDENGYRLERHYPAGGSSVVVGSKTYASTVSTGSVSLSFDHADGIITVSDAEGASIDYDWDAAIPSSPLTNYQSSAFTEIIAPSDPTRVMRYTEMSARP